MSRLVVTISLDKGMQRSHCVTHRWRCVGKKSLCVVWSVWSVWRAQVSQDETSFFAEDNIQTVTGFITEDASANYPQYNTINWSLNIQSAMLTMLKAPRIHIPAKFWVRTGQTINKYRFNLSELNEAFE